MGTQYGIECWCAQDAAEEVDYSRHGEGAQCDKRCGGDQVGCVGKLFRKYNAVVVRIGLV